jgi:polyhydroxybutyrate depolymerase
MKNKLSKRVCLLFAMACFMGWAALAQAGVPGTFTTHTVTWNGLSRMYAVYVPTHLPPGSPMVLHLHATAVTPSTTIPFQLVSQWESLAQSNSFLMVWPISSYNTRANSFYWDSFDMDYSFAQPPDDVGFLRNLIVTLSAQYAINPKGVFVAGMSSGAMMAQRVGVQISDLVAAIAPVSGQLLIKQMTDCFALPASTTPVSVLEMHGDVDAVLPYCGLAPKTIWNETGLTLGSVDDDVSYWKNANECTNASTTESLCNNGQPTTSVDNQDATGCAGGVEVRFVRQVGQGHVWGQGTEKVVWQFFSTHFRQ